MSEIEASLSPKENYRDLLKSVLKIAKEYKGKTPLQFSGGEVFHISQSFDGVTLYFTTKWNLADLKSETGGYLNTIALSFYPDSFSLTYPEAVPPRESGEDLKITDQNAQEQLDKITDYVKKINELFKHLNLPITIPLKF